MKTSRQQTAEINARLAAHESQNHAWESELADRQHAHEAEIAALHAPRRAAHAATHAASHQADADFLAWRREHGL